MFHFRPRSFCCVLAGLLGVAQGAMAASEGDVRLVRGGSSDRGVLEIFHDNQWGTVCEEGFDDVDAGVACRQLGYDEGEFTGTDGRGPDPTGPIWLRDVACTGTETRLADCPASDWGVDSCLNWQDVIIECSDTDPQHPSGITVSGASKRSVRVSWTAPETESAITDYDYRYRKAGASAWTEVTDTTLTATEVTITGLTEGTRYQVQVRATNSNGTSSWSDSASGRTWAVPKAPGGLKLTATSGTSLKASWTAPTAAPAVTDYDYRYRVVSDPEAAWTEVTDTTLTATEVAITGLTAMTLYQVAVRATNDVGTGGWSGSASITMPDRREGNLRLRRGASSDRGVLEIFHGTQWGTVCGDGFDDVDAGVACRQLGYDLGTVTGTDERGPDPTGPIWLDQVACTGSETRLAHCPHRGWGNHGCFYWDDVIIRCFGADAVPDRPGGVTVSGTSTTSLKVSWTAPVTPLALAVTDYDYRYRVVSDPVASWTEITDTTLTATEATISSLTEGKRYEVQVRATNANGAGAWSGSASGSTWAKPEPPGGVMVSVVSATSLKLSWTAPDATPAVTDYDYRYRVVSDPEASWTEVTDTTLTDTEVTITGLTTGSPYEAAVRATSDAGPSEWSESASLTLPNWQEGDLRLRGGSSGNRGRLEIFHDSQWGTVCDDNFGDVDAGVACRQLGHDSGVVTSDFSAGTGTIWLDEVACTGSESRLADCAHAGWGGSNCTHVEDVSIRCWDADPAKDPAFGSESTTRSMNEKVLPLAVALSPAIAATDPNGDELSYTLRGSDASHFEIDAAGVVRSPASHYPVDYDAGTRSFEFEVVATDPSKRSDSIRVTVNVQNVNEPPAFADLDARHFKEHSPAGTAAGDSAFKAHPIKATDPEGGVVTMTLQASNDHAKFVLDATSGSTAAGTLKVAAGPQDGRQHLDYESGDTHTVIIQASDAQGNQGSVQYTIRVHNVAETGVVALSSDAPKVEEELSGTLTDPDGGVENLAWQWQRSADGASDTYADISGETGASYTPVVGDIDYHLRLRAQYDDATGTGKTAYGVGANTVDPASAPLVTNRPPSFPAETASRSVAEGSAAGTQVGGPVVASDEDEDDSLTYTLGGTDAASFALDDETGQLTVGTGVSLDHETKQVYVVDVTATDESQETDTVRVTVRVSDVDEEPALSGSAAVSFAEGGTGRVALYTAEDPEEGTLTWSLGGADAARFAIADGLLSFGSAPDFEQAGDTDGDNVYEVTVQVTDGTHTPSLAVRVTVTNEDEEGAVSVSSRQAQAGTALEATVSDPDGGVTGESWSWSRGMSGTGPWTALSGATSARYTPAEADVGGHLRVAVAYTDAHGAGKGAGYVFEGAVQAAPVTNRAPEFDSERVTRRLAENAPRGASVGDAVSATDPDEDPLTYVLDGADAGAFEVAEDTGALTVASGVEVDYETTKVYEVSLTATDPSGESDEVEVRVEVENEDEAPSLNGPATVSYPEQGHERVAQYTASDPEGAAIEWSLGGADAGAFTLSGGELHFGSAPDYEQAGDTDGDNVYEVTVQVTDGTHTPSLAVRVTVSNVEEPGTLAFSSLQPQAGTRLGVELEDPDGGVQVESWQWSRGNTREGPFTVVAGADSGYTPSRAEVGSFLRVVVFYVDGEGPAKSAQAVMEHSVAPAPEVNRAPVFGQAEVAREVAAGSRAGTPVGEPVTASDPDGEVLTYALGGTDAGHFEVDAATGQLRVSAAGSEALEAGARHTVEVRASDPSGLEARVRVVVTVGEALPVVRRVPLLPPASHRHRDGVVRVINRSGQGGEVSIVAFDDAGGEYEPLRLAIGANEAVQFRSVHLEGGNPDKGLEPGTGEGDGDWRLELASRLDLEVLSYVRTKGGGPLASLHDVAPQVGSEHRVAFFNPASNRSRASRLRLINPGEEAAAVRIDGMDDAGEAGESTVELTLPARASRTLGARTLEAGGEGLTGALGDGAGKWRLRVSADRPIRVMSLLEHAQGAHLTNVSTAPAPEGSVHRVPQLPPAAHPYREGVVRVVNRSAEGGEVSIRAFDEAGMEYGPLSLRIEANEAVHLTSADLESGNPDKGLEGATGEGEGVWRLTLASRLDLAVLSYARTTGGGALASLHDVAPSPEEGVYRVAFFNPGSNRSRESRLRLVNPGEEAAAVRIDGVDDAGVAGESTVELTLPAGSSRALSARTLEAGGEGLTGALGDGAGKWRLRVSADRPIRVMSLLLDTGGGHLTNLSTGPVQREDAPAPSTP